MSAQTWLRQPIIRLREHPERLAWTVIFASFGVFIALAIVIPWSIRYAVQYANVRQEARLEPTLGTLFYYPPRSDEPIALTEPRDEVMEGSRIVAGDSSTQGTIFLFSDDNSGEAFGSVRLYANTDISVEDLRRPRFEGSEQPNFLRLRMDKGQAALFTESEGSNVRPILVELETPHGQTIFNPGNYQLSVTSDRTEITVREGTAALSSPAGENVTIDSAVRGWITQDGLTLRPASEQQDLLDSGSYAEMWETYRFVENSVEPGDIYFRDSEGRDVVFFTRTDGPNAHTEVGIRQPINVDVNIYQFLNLQFDVRILSQNLAGGGVRGSEYPVRVEITYTDEYGSVRTWGHGFYYADPLQDEDSNNDYWPLADSTKIEQGVWRNYQSPNLIDLWTSQGTKPVTINSIRIYASGHKYQSMVSEVYLQAQ